MSIEKNIKQSYNSIQAVIRDTPGGSMEWKKRKKAP